jgi:excinuclease ABC subunit C
LLVRKIHDIKTTKVETELDALLLENNLIKSLKPRYNVNLRDDKTYPWIIIKNERFPRVFYTRKKIKDGSLYFGPYANVKVIKHLLDLIKELYPIRNCSLDLKQENIDKKKIRPCLEYHVGKCKAPCANLQGEEEYNKNINEIKHIIKGNLHFAIRDLKEEMRNCAENLKFEEAELLKQRIEMLEAYQSRSTIVHPTITDTDVFNVYSDAKNGYVTYFKIVNGAIVQSHTVEIRKKIDESDEEILVFAMIDLRQRFQSQSKEILLPFEPEITLPECQYTVPKIGDKKKLLDLCLKNAMEFKREHDKQTALTDPENNTKRIMQQMMKDLRMKEEPKRIEGFDNSNMQGNFAVSAMPVFIDGKPAKKEYRHFNIKTVDGPDDFASMEEVIYRRYKRVLDEKLPMPQLIVIDGGKGQLSAAVNSLKKLKLFGKVAIVGIAKRLEEIYFPGDSLPLYLDKRSETLKIIQHIRDEAHRFGITHHRNKRSKETIKSELSEIKGISEKTAQKLFSELKSMQTIKESSLEDLSKVVGQSKAELIFNYYH